MLVILYFLKYINLMNERVFIRAIIPEMKSTNEGNAL